MIDTWKGLSSKARQGNLGRGQDPILAEPPGQGEICDTGPHLALSGLRAEAHGVLPGGEPLWSLKTSWV